jgi:hypothetical protein
VSADGFQWENGTALDGSWGNGTAMDETQNQAETKWVLLGERFGERWTTHIAHSRAMKLNSIVGFLLVFVFGLQVFMRGVDRAVVSDP